MVRILVVAVLVGACGRLRFDAHADARVTDSDPDAPADACTFGPWQPPVALTAFNSASDDYGPALSNDGQTLVFASSRSGSGDLFQVPWSGGTPQAIAGLDTAQADWGPTWSSDDSTLDFSSNRGGPYQMFTATYDGATFGPPMVVSELPVVIGPYMTFDGLELFFNDADVGGHLLHSIRAAPTDAWPPGVELTELEQGNNGWVTASRDALTIMFVTDRDGSYDLYQATRPARDQPFVPAAPITELNTATNDVDPDLSFDGLTMRFASTRSGLGGYDLFETTRACM